jgi:ferric-dicitrate binding protein FerR (iron transport regulator)
MNRQELFELIDKWTKGEATEQEVKALMNYYYSFRGTGEWDDLQLGSLRQFEAEMEQRLLDNIRQTPPETTPVRRIWWPKVAVAVVVLLLAGALWTYLADWRQLSRPVKTKEIVTLPGQHRQVKLPDGTQVWLSPASSLLYAKDFVGGERHVWLDGEAFFDVAQDPAHPFGIVTGGALTTVLGTSFNIQAYPGQADFRVTVVTGKVTVSKTRVSGTSSRKAAITVSPNQRADFNNLTGTISVSDHVDTEPFLLRRTGTLKYKGAPLQEVVSTLGNYYNVSITIDGPTADCFYFGEFRIDKGLEKALQQLCLTLNATLVKEGATYIIKKGRC